MKPIHRITILLIAFVLTTCFQAHAADPIADPGSRGVDWDAVKEKVDKHDWAKDVVARMKSDVRAAQSRYDRPPLGTTGWLHEYYCDDDARRLQFDPKKPHEHVCTKCGRVYSGTPYDDCWRSMVHSETATAVMQSAILYRITGDERWFEYARKTLLWYANNFDQFAPHGDHAGKGIVREQSLDEATQMVRLVQAYWDICKDLSPEDRDAIANQFLLPDARFIHKQTRTIHNIHSWHNAAAGLVGLAVGDKELSSQTIDGEFGLKKQIEKGIIADGFWFEGSIGYHFYTVSSLQPLYAAARAQNISLEGTDKFKKMYTAPVRFAFPNGEFPATNDGWPGQTLDSKDSYFEVACSLWDDPTLVQSLANFYADRKRNSTEALLYGPVDLPKAQPLPPQSVLFKDSGVAILRNDEINAYLKFGPYGGGHDHLDRLNVSLYAAGNVVMPDLGTSGYGISLNAWYRSSAAHNLLAVDGKRQKRCGGYLVDYSENSVTAGVKDAYDGVDMQRALSINERGVQDEIRAYSSDVHQYDIFYHIRGSLKSCTIPLQETKLSEKSNGYNYLKNVQKGNLKSNSELIVVWMLRDAPGELVLRGSSTEEYEIYIGECPDNPADETMSVLMLRTKQKRTEWKSGFHVTGMK